MVSTLPHSLSIYSVGMATVVPSAVLSVALCVISPVVIVLGMDSASMSISMDLDVVGELLLLLPPLNAAPALLKRNLTLSSGGLPLVPDPAKIGLAPGLDSATALHHSILAISPDLCITRLDLSNLFVASSFDSRHSLLGCALLRENAGWLAPASTLWLGAARSHGLSSNLSEISSFVLIVKVRNFRFGSTLA